MLRQQSESNRTYSLPPMNDSTHRHIISFTQSWDRFFNFHSNCIIKREKILSLSPYLPSLSFFTALSMSTTLLFASAFHPYLSYLTGRLESLTSKSHSPSMRIVPNFSNSPKTCFQIECSFFHCNANCDQTV